MRVLRESTVSDFDQHPADRTTTLKFNVCHLIKTHSLMNEYCIIFRLPKNMLVYDLNRIFLSYFISVSQEQFLVHVFKIFIFQDLPCQVG